MSEDFSDKTRTELRALALEKKIPRASSLKKTELVEHISRDERWQVMKRSALDDEARRLGIEDPKSRSKSELIRDLHAAYTRAESVVAAPTEEPETALRPAPMTLAGTRPSLGRLLQAGGYAGLILALVVAVMLPIAATLAAPRIEGRLANLAAQLIDVSELLEATSLALENASVALGDTSGGLATTQLTLANSQPLLDSVSDLLGSQAPDTIRSTRTALLGAQEGARAMDRVLRGLAFFGLSYDPEVPLDESLALTAESLEPLPGALVRVKSDIDIVKIDLQLLEEDMGRVARDLDELSEVLSPLGEDLRVQSDSLKEAAASLEGIGPELRRWLLGIALIGSLLAVWVALGQAGLIVIGGWLREGVPVRTNG